MKVYLVGGAVRDQLLGIPIKEKDWVIVGGMPQDLLKEGYTQVGKDFPVFLHPKTKEEYALARTERKSSVGYYGFTCDFNPKVTLEEDLSRRDLTINAMALSEEGDLIDPYHGYADLKSKCLRHVSPAFVEDPVRVLRVARFAARFHHLGFTLAEETRALMFEMVKNGELSHLISERVWQEFEKSLIEKNPEQFLLILRSCGALHEVMPELDQLFGIPNPIEVYPKIDSGLQALDALIAVTRISTDPVLRFASLFYNNSHLETPMRNWPFHAVDISKGRMGIDQLGRRLKIPNDYLNLGRMTAQYGPTVQSFEELNAEQILNVFEQADAFRRPERFDQFLWVCDVILGHHHIEKWRKLRHRCESIDVQSIIAQGYKGQEIKKELDKERLKIILAFLKREMTNGDLPR